jgi:hypothetical protein
LGKRCATPFPLRPLFPSDPFSPRFSPRKMARTRSMLRLAGNVYILFFIGMLVIWAVSQSVRLRYFSANMAGVVHERSRISGRPYQYVDSPAAGAYRQTISVAGGRVSWWREYLGRSPRYETSMPIWTFERLRPFDAETLWGYRWHRKQVASSQNGLTSNTREWSGLGFEGVETQLSDGQRSRHLRVPFSGLAIAFGIPAALVLRRRASDWKMGRRRRMGFCPSCGYDLRGTARPGKCPECGEPAPDAVQGTGSSVNCG